MSEPNYEQIRQRITERYNNRITFFSHLVAFLVVNGVAWFLWFATPEAARNAVLSVLLLLTSAGWLVGMLIHTTIYLMTEARERAIDRAIEDERAWALGEKPKRDSRLYLSEDGELVNILDDDQPEQVERRR